MTEKRLLEDETPVTTKTMRYDRQLRLWGDEGQTLLENSTVCLFNATTLGCEILKNLILPGVGKVSIVDNRNVTLEDIQTNFFLSSHDIGGSIAPSVSAKLQQLNTDVKMDYYNLSISEFVHHHLDSLKFFSIFIACNVQYAEVKEVVQVAWDAKIPFIFANSLGMYSDIKLVIKEHFIIESKPDSILPDLRLDIPFTELLDFYQNVDFSQFNDTEHAHIPFITILLKCLDQWKQSHNGEIPKNYKEKTAFKQLIHNLRRKPDEENFNEAISNVNKCIFKTSLPSSIQQLFDDPRICNLTPCIHPFWVTCAALKQFYNVKGVLPITGTVQDMTSDSQSYITLQNIYRNKALCDAEQVWVYTQSICKKHHIPLVDKSYVFKMSKNCPFLRVFETNQANVSADVFREAVEVYLDDANDIAHVPILFQAYFNFISEKGYPPGVDTQNIPTDESEFKDIVCSLQKKYGLPDVYPSSLVEDFVRYGGTEIPSVSTFMGKQT